LSNELEHLRLRVAELEKHLKDSEERFFKIFHAASNPMTITTIAEGRVVYVNEANAQLGGFKRNELIGRTTKDSGVWANPDQRELFIKKLSEDGKVYNLEVEAKTRNGEVRNLLLSADPITVDGTPCLLGVSTDITKQTREAEALRKSEEKYRMLIENSLQGLSIIQNGQFIFCNRAYCEMSGYSKEELLSMSPQEMGTMVHPEDRAFMLQRYKDRLAGKPVPSRYEYRGIRKNGEEYWLEVYASSIEYNGAAALQLATIDITEQKLAEKRLKESKEYLNQIINSIGDPIIVRDRNHRFVHVNDAFCAFTGKDRDQIFGVTGFEYLPEAQAKKIMDEEENVFSTGKECVSEEEVNDSYGRLHIIASRKALLTDKDGHKQIVCLLRDISEQKRLQAQFMQAQKMEAVGVLAGGVAHDFNNLLSVIKGYTELLIEDLSESDPQYEDLKQIEKAAQRATSLTAQLLAFSRKQILKPEILNLNAVLSETNNMLRRLIGEDIELVYVASPDLGLIHADPGQIQQVLMNLAVNAREAMPHGGKLTIEAVNLTLDEPYAQIHSVVKPGNYVMMAVSDDGVGMDSATLARIFEPFFTTKEKSKGTGLGLSTVYGIVKQSNGYIWVYSEPGVGTTFKIYFPRVTSGIPVVEEEQKSEFHGNETILFVEDEDSVRNLANRILQQKGYKTLVAANGMEALRMAGDYDGKIHLVLTDVVMPGMSGTTLVTRLQAMRPGIKSLYVSGYTDNGIVHHGTLDSDVAFLQKPFSIESLTQKVRHVIDS
jgi:two-component system, cell cycle sensor histidine kinase and response regulator CckA